jgi:hypothetical protein
MEPFEKRLERAALLGLQDFGRLVFARSQQRVPVKTGRLKRSGYVRILRDGVELGYTAPYAKDVEQGSPARLERVNPRARRAGVSARAVRVRAYTRRVGARKPRHFVKNSVDEYIPRLGQIVGRRLREEFGR